MSVVIWDSGELEKHERGSRSRGWDWIGCEEDAPRALAVFAARNPAMTFEARRYPHNGKVSIEAERLTDTELQKIRRR